MGTAPMKMQKTKTKTNNIENEKQLTAFWTVIDNKQYEYVTKNILL